MNPSDLKTLITIIREVVHGYYVIIYSDTVSYKVCKLNRDEFPLLFREGSWLVETRDELTRFMKVSPDDSTATDYEILETFNTYTIDGETRISSVSVVCDWSVYELVFDGKFPENWLKSITTEKN